MRFFSVLTFYVKVGKLWFWVGKIVVLNEIPDGNLQDCRNITLYDNKDLRNAINYSQIGHK